MMLFYVMAVLQICKTAMIALKARGYGCFSHEDTGCGKLFQNICSGAKAPLFQLAGKEYAAKQLSQ
jgi:hypothetical protein